MDKGICYIKPEFIINDVKHETTDDPDRNPLKRKAEDEAHANGSEKYEKTDKKGKKKKNRGQNKSRPIFKAAKELNLCYAMYDGPGEKKCEHPKCVFRHDLEQYLKDKPKDIGETCYIYDVKGFCARGLACRFAGAHIDENMKNLKSEKYNPDAKLSTTNGISSELQQILKKHQYNFEKSEKIVAKYQKLRDQRVKQQQDEERNERLEKKEEESEETKSEVKSSGCVVNEDEIPLNKREKKKIDFRNKIVLSPLTTVGNLPFRRICKEFGADITCGEMACAVPILKGLTQEWALTKRHESEDIFGVQLCGNNALLITRAAQLIEDQTDVDFIDLNIGCPIDLIFEQGGGSALIRRVNVLEVTVRSCSDMLNIPFTVKTRTGVYANKSVAHELVPKFEEWGASAVTIHGRSREQRYTKSADWEYIEQCASKAKDLPIIGNGDILNYEDYNEAKKSAPHVSSVMVGRGALIKPWIFKEIKEQKEWHPTSSDRLEILKKYVNYGLEHWGSDTKGVETTRRFLLEWLSFLYRYVPLELQLNPPQKINQRPQNYHGRDELETLMSSNNCNDWIKISEMLLGPVPDGFTFLPKHKANSYA